MIAASPCRAALGVLRVAMYAASVLCLVEGMRARSMPPVSKTVVMGSQLFQVRGCAHCHGVDAEGSDRAPSLRGIRRRMQRDAIEQQIREGGKEMPAFGDSLTSDELHALVEYMEHVK